MKKSAFNPMSNPDSWLATLSYQELTDLNKRIAAKLENDKAEMRKKLLSDFTGQLASLDLTLEDLGLGQGGKSSATRKRKAHAGPCPVCKFATEPSHDGRKHRSQGDNKKPFTKAELDALHLARA